MSARFRTLVVDDEPAARDAIRGLLAGDPEIQLVGECPDGASAVAAIREHAPDLLFLDIQMPELDGFGVLRQLDPAELPVIVFVTAYDRYALRAFDVHAVDYLLKPFDDDRFLGALERAKTQARNGKIIALRQQLLDLLAHEAPVPVSAADGPYLRRLVVRADGRATVLDVGEIDWIEADGDHVRIHVKKVQHVLRETMKHLEGRLEPARFIRIHRSTIVNVERIRELQPYFRGEYVVLLHDGTSLKLSRSFKPRLEAALGQAI